MRPNNRKNEHVSLAEKFFQESGNSSFEDIKFVHHSFPEMSLKEANISTTFAGFQLDAPFYINAMSGGSEWTKKLNEKLAIVARDSGLAIAPGSVSAALKDSSVEDSFTIVRDVNPTGLVFANLGAGQTTENAKRAIDLLKADALQIHINAPQELIMPEGDRDFSGWLEGLEAIVQSVGVPVIAKEVGFGMSQKTIESLLSIGIQTIDISGNGGTNFAQIENYRRKTAKMDFLENWGQSTAVSLLEAQDFLGSVDVLASGGIRHPLEIVKALALGARATGVSGFFLHSVLKEGIDETIQLANDWKEQVAVIQTLLGKRTVSELQQTDLVLTGEVKDWCESRGLSYSQFARRSN